MTKTSKFSRLMSAALTGLVAGSLLTACGESKGKAGTDANGCSGPNGCGGQKDKSGKEKNSCSGPNGCNGHGTKEKNSCSGPNGCNGHGTKKEK